MKQSTPPLFPQLYPRNCPICASDSQQSILELDAASFIHSNPAYRMEKITALGLPIDRSYSIVKCVQCGMIYSLYHLDADSEAQIYNLVIDPEISLSKVMTVNRRIQDIQRWLGLLSLVNREKPGEINLNVMDYGCGWGTHLLVAEGPGVQVVGYDVTEWKVEWARQQGLTICTTYDGLKKFAPYDIAICTSVLEHVHSPRETIQEISTLLRPGAYALITCIVTAVTQESDWAEMKRRISSDEILPKEINPWEHLNYFTVETLTRLMRENGFVPVDPYAEAQRSKAPQSRTELIQNVIRSWKSGHTGFRTMAAYARSRGRHHLQMAPAIPIYWQYTRD